MYFARQILITAAAVCLWAALPAAAAVKENTEPLYDLHEARVLKAREFETSGDDFSFFENQYKTMALFPVPQANSIGTIDKDDALTLISFPGKIIKFNNYFKGTFSNIETRYAVRSVSFEDRILISNKSEVFVLNFREKSIQKHQLDSFVYKMAIADASNHTVIFESDEHLKLIDLNGKNFGLIKEIELSDEQRWSVGSEKIFLYNFRRLNVFDNNFEPTKHPLPELLSRRPNYSLSKIHPHPYLPFAILSYREGGPKIISWEEGRDNRPKSIFGDEKHFIHYSFSPDGRWVLLRVESHFKSPEKTYLIPVSEKFPYYLGPPMLLAFVEFERNGLAWTTNPVSLVGSSGKKIYRWDLTNEAHPESDKPTYWDYVVERDLRNRKRWFVVKRIENERRIEDQVVEGDLTNQKGRAVAKKIEEKPDDEGAGLKDQEIWGLYKKKVRGSGISLSVRPVEGGDGPRKAALFLDLSQKDGRTLRISGEGIVRGQTVVAYSTKFRLTVTFLGAEADILLEESCGGHRFYEGYGYYSEDCDIGYYHSLDSLSSGLEKVEGQWR